MEISVVIVIGIVIVGVILMHFAILFVVGGSHCDANQHSDRDKCSLMRVRL